MTGQEVPMNQPSKKQQSKIPQMIQGMDYDDYYAMYYYQET
jgi:hypothetical protein